MNPKIVIIGAGAAGIAAAARLYENGFRNIVILEAENRIGGRIYTIPFGANVIELGAQWCHGEKDNVVYELAKDYNVLSSTTTKYDEFEFRRSDGELIDYEKGDKLSKLATSITEDFPEEMSAYESSFGHFVIEKYWKVLATDENFKDIEGALASQFLDFFYKYKNSNEVSDTWFDMSTFNFMEYWDCEGDRLLNWKDHGFAIILDILMRKYPDPAKRLPIDEKILLNKTVSRINWSSGSDKLVEVQCSDGSIYQGDHVICTVSLGVLQAKYLELFKPELPILKKNAIKGLMIGTLGKIFIEFAEPFWPKDWLGVSLLWRKTDLDATIKLHSEWITDIFGFYIVDFQPNVLSGWISGASARRMENATDEEVRDGVMYLLRKFLGKWRDVPDPINVITSKWYTNPNFRGTYSCRVTSTDLLRTSARDLAVPLTNSLGMPVLLFGGEATHDHYFSTVHGAIESGWREAQRVIDLYKPTKAHL